MTEENRHEYVELMVDYLLNRWGPGYCSAAVWCMCACVCVCVVGARACVRRQTQGGMGTLPSFPSTRFHPPQNRSIHRQFEAFFHGFRILCDGPAIRLFNACELERLVRTPPPPPRASPFLLRPRAPRARPPARCQLPTQQPPTAPGVDNQPVAAPNHRRFPPLSPPIEKVCGNPNLDFAALERNAKYEGGFNTSAPAVQWLWGIVKEELTFEEKKMFLKFFTGSDRWGRGGCLCGCVRATRVALVSHRPGQACTSHQAAAGCRPRSKRSPLGPPPNNPLLNNPPRSPIGGLGALKCVIQRDGPDSLKLPTSHTCFNTLLLPEYATREKMADRLRLAILNAEGFGLE